MNMTEIRKESLSCVEVDNIAMSELAQSAKEILGYSVLAILTEKKEIANLTELQLVLKSLDLDILNEDDVKKYKKIKLIEGTVVKFKEWLDQAKSKEEDARQFTGEDWYEQEIDKYDLPIPEFVLAKAIQIKQAFPLGVICIESLRGDPDPFLSVKVVDSQYSWRTKERYYIEVWDEPKFTGKISTAQSNYTDEISF